MQGKIMAPTILHRTHHMSFADYTSRLTPLQIQQSRLMRGDAYIQWLNEQDRFVNNRPTAAADKRPKYEARDSEILRELQDVSPACESTPMDFEVKWAKTLWSKLTRALRNSFGKRTSSPSSNPVR
jgi:hypothetical protein